MKTRITNILIALVLVSLPSLALAAIDVDFETTPLFGVSNFLPGDTVTKTVTVTNTGETAQDVYTELLNVVDGGLANKASVAITSGGNLYSGSFDEYDDAGEVFLSTLGSGDSVTYTFAMHFAPESGNEYQLKSLGFDLCIGFSGGQFECDTDDPEYSQGSYSSYSQGSYGSYSQGSYGSYSQGSYSSYSQGSYGGNGDRIELTSDGGNDGERPVPQVAGESASIFPFGAPNTGFGAILQDEGAVVKFVVLFLILSVLATLIYMRRKLELR